MDKSRSLLVVAITACSLLLISVSACGQDGSSTIKTVRSGESIQAVVDKSHIGDLILIEPGVYHEEVVVDIPDVTLRGLDRNDVVIDGQNKMASGITVTADGVSVENLTIHDFAINGLFFTGLIEKDRSRLLNGFRANYITAYNNGLYGIYAFQASNGEITNSYASGHPDSGFYVGQCGAPDTQSQLDNGVDMATSDVVTREPCNVLVSNVTASFNAVGYEGTNGSQVYVVNSRFDSNRLGMTPNSQSLEKRAPQTQTFIVGNTIINNNNASAPEQASGAFGVGIYIGSGVSNVVERNRIEGNTHGGVIISRLDKFFPVGNQVRGNFLANNSPDLGYWISGGTTPVRGNCFDANAFSSSIPDDIEATMPCTDSPESILAPMPDSVVESPPGPAYSDVTTPQKQETMPGDLTVPPPAAVFVKPDLDTIEVPQ